MPSRIPVCGSMIQTASSGKQGILYAITGGKSFLKLPSFRRKYPPPPWGTGGGQTKTCERSEHCFSLAAPHGAGIGFRNNKAAHSLRPRRLWKLSLRQAFQCGTGFAGSRLPCGGGAGHSSSSPDSSFGKASLRNPSAEKSTSFGQVIPIDRKSVV